MPPKKKTQTNSGHSSLESLHVAMEEKSVMESLEELLDCRLKQQVKEINDMFVKFSNTTKMDLEEVKKVKSF